MPSIQVQGAWGGGGGPGLDPANASLPTCSEHVGPDCVWVGGVLPSGYTLHWSTSPQHCHCGFGEISEGGGAEGRKGNPEPNEKCWRHSGVLGSATSGLAKSESNFSICKTA